VSAGTILREVGVLRAALNWAVDHKRLTVAPHIPNPVQQPQGRQRWLTKEEGRKLIAACREPHMKLFVMLGLMTAARTSAILELTWDRVDLDHRLVDYGEGHGNKRRAVAPINAELETAMRAAKAFAGDETAGHVIEYHGDPVVAIKKGFRGACERAGLVGVTPHILRHSAASWMAQAGVPFRQIAQMLGDEEKTVEKVYAKFSPDYLRDASAALQLG
jgi:integrase